MKYFTALLSLYVGLGFISYAHAADYTESHPMMKTGKNVMQATDAIQVEAQVVSVDKKTREITLKTQDGEVVAVRAGNEVRNFAQIKKGDMLRVRYFESLMLELKQSGKDPVAVSEMTDTLRAQPGQKPRGAVIERVTATGTVTNVDSTKSVITLQGPERSVVLHVPKKDVLDKIKKGDQIQAVYTEALAVSVESVKR